MLKFCNCCKKEKSLEEFTKMGRKDFTKGNIKRTYKNSDGYHSYCKECNALRAKEFRQRHKTLTGNSDYRGSGKSLLFLKKIDYLCQLLEIEYLTQNLIINVIQKENST